MKKKKRHIAPSPPPVPNWNKPEELWQFQDNDLDWSQPNALTQVADDCGLTEDDQDLSYDDFVARTHQNPHRRIGRKNRRAV